MGFERVALFGILDVELESTGLGFLTLATDLPGNGMAVRETRGILATGRRVLRFRLQGTTKGRLYSFKAVPAAPTIIRLYGARLWVRILPGAEWQWITVPIPETSDWQQVKLPIPEMGEWTASKLPIPETGEWAASKLPIPEMGEWTRTALPIKPTPQNSEWVDIPVDQ